MARHAALAGNCLIERWASPESTIARIDATIVRDQLAETGHDVRVDDAQRIADLGVTASRVPVLWERVAARGPRQLDLREPARRLHALRSLGVEPIVTLLHHGSGPLFTDLLDPLFAEAFAEYAGAVARAFPWVRRWTPINEPLTTARFSTLYGTWYPNLRDDRGFGRALVHQTRAQQLAMVRIREANPDAEFVFTEDLQRFVAGDAASREYASFLTERAMLSIELVAGRVDRRHPLAAFLRDRCGVGAPEFTAMMRAATPPDLVAFNHYPHSERYIFQSEDGALGDVAALHVRGATTLRVAPLLRAAATRLELPLALGEVHVHAPAAERVRWLQQHYEDAQMVHDEGVDIRAVGAWAAFGMADWRSLLRQRDGMNEDGIYTFAGPSGTPQPTAVATALRRLAAGQTIDDLAQPGWWERDDRYREPDTLRERRDPALA